MSETDDTDVLLLIPPDLFLVPSSDDSCPETTRTVLRRPQVDHISETLHSLETRVQNLELSIHSDISNTPSISTCKRSYTLSEKSRITNSSLEKLDRRSFTFPRRRKRKPFSRKIKNRFDHSLISTRSSSAENIPPLALSSSAPKLTGLKEKIYDYFTMDGDISSINSTPTKNNDKLLLNEVDEFINKIESYETPDAKYKVSLDEKENLVEATKNYLSHKTENSSDCVTLPSGRTVTNDLLAKYIYLTKGSDTNLPSTSTYQTKDTSKFDYVTKSTQEATPKQNEMNTQEKCNSVRKLNFDSSSQPTSTPKPLTRGNTISNLDSLRMTSNKIYDKGSKMFDQYKSSLLTNCDTSVSLSSYASPQKDDFGRRYIPEKRYGSEQKPSDLYQHRKARNESKFPNSIDTDLLSLSELWCDQDGQRSDHGKLEEERLKREHCESVIQDLQKQILTQQEKLAVAVRVDRAKDNAISRLRDAWVRITNSLESAEERHKMALDKMTVEADRLKRNAEEAQKKTQHFEREMYKTLDLAHDYQEKCKAADDNKLQKERQLEELTASHEEAVRKKEAEIEVFREKCESLARLNKQLTDCIKNAEEELEKERSDHLDTKSRLSEANKLTHSFQEELTLVQQERDILKDKIKEERARCAILERENREAEWRLSEVLKKESALDNEVKSVRKHLELQKSELKSYYQKQLEEAVLAKLKEFQQQLDAAEREMESGSKARESEMQEEWARRMQRVEEQHKLEVNILEEKQKEEIKLYRLQLAQSSEKIAALENKVESYRRRRGQIATQLHHVMESQWRQALQILGSGARAASTDTSVHQLSGNDNHQLSTPDFLTHNHKTQSLPTLNEQVASNYRPSSNSNNGLIGLDDKLTIQNLSCERKNVDGLSDTEIQHYVKMLLTRPPDFLDGSGDTGALASLDESKCPQEEPTSDRADSANKQKKKSGHLKPPWKA